MFGMQDGRTDQSRPSRLLPGYGKPLGEILGWSPTPGGSSTNSDELGIIPSRLAFFFLQDRPEYQYDVRSITLYYKPDQVSCPSI